MTFDQRKICVEVVNAVLSQPNKKVCVTVEFNECEFSLEVIPKGEQKA